MSERTDTSQVPTTGRTDSTVVPLPPRGRSCGRNATPAQGPAQSPAPDRLWREVLGETMRRHRIARKERLKDTADRAGISPQYLSELERGMKDPSSEILEAVAGALGKSSFDLTRGAIRSWAPTSPATTTGTGGAVLMCAA